MKEEPTRLRPLAEAVKRTARTLALASSAQKNAALLAMAKEIRAAADAIGRANAEDVQESRAAGKNAAFLDRLTLTPERIEAMARALLEVAALPDPIGEVTESFRRPNGLRIERVRLPLGCILIVT